MCRAFYLTQTFLQMEKEKLSEQLKGMVGENSLSQRTWDDYIENSVMPFLPTEEDKQKDYLTKHATALKSINGQLNNEVATKVNDFKKNFKTTPPETLPKDNPEKAVSENQKLEELEKRLQRFEKAEEEKKVAKYNLELLSKVEEEMKTQGATNETILKLILTQLNANDKTTVADLAKEGKAMYDKTYSDLYGNESYVPAYNSTSATGRKGDKDAYMKHLQETGRLQKT